MKATDWCSDPDSVRFLVEAAARAPSVHNTQPWWFGTRGTTVTVHADSERRLKVADPDGREMLISCGAALFTLCLAARRLGRRPQVEFLSDPERPWMLADVALGAPQPVTEAERAMYDQIRRRRTHRGGFRPEGLPRGLLQALRAHAYEEGVMLQIVADPRVRIAIAALTEAAEQVECRDPSYMIEMARWAPRPGSERRDGVHADSYPHRPSPTDPDFAARDFARGHDWGFVETERHGAAGVTAVLATAQDDRAGWLRAGQALQWTLLRAAEDGVAAAFHTQALEIPVLREFIRTQFCDGAHPQMIIRLGMADEEPVSVRRPADELTRPEP